MAKGDLNAAAGKAQKRAGVGRTAALNAARAVAGRKGSPAKFGRIDRREGKRGAKPGEVKRAVRNARRGKARGTARMFPGVAIKGQLAGGLSH